MKREILFRGKRVDNGEWVEGYYGVKGKGTDLEQHVIMTNTLGNGSIPYFYFTDIVVDPETVGQYTGLTDKNGVKIFEGDIFKDNFTGKTYIVEFSDGSFGSTDIHGVPLDDLYMYDFESDCEIIGNINTKPAAHKN